MALQSYDLIVEELGRPKDKASSGLDILFNKIGIGPSQIEIKEAATAVLEIVAKLRITAGVDDTDVVIKSQMDGADSALQGQIDDIVDEIGIINSDISDLQAAVGTFYGTLNTFYDVLDRMHRQTPLEQTFTATEGQTLFNATDLEWTDDDTNLDILVYRNGKKMEQSITGALDKDFRKNSGTQIEFAYGLRLNAKITIRHNLPWAAVAPFLTYISGLYGNVVPTSGTYKFNNNQLAVFKNGLYMYLTSNPAIGDAASRYLESYNFAVSIEEAAVPSDFFVLYNRPFVPAYRNLTNGLTGLTLSTPPYVMGNKSLMVYRDGYLLNASGLGPDLLKYTEVSIVSISILVASLATTVWIFEVHPTAPTWRQDITGIVGVTLNFSSSYVMASQRLALYKNGKLMMNTANTSLGTANDRYVEATTTSVTLETASIADDVWSAIYF